jgi:predicted metalloprotease
MASSLKHGAMMMRRKRILRQHFRLPERLLSEEPDREGCMRWLGGRESSNIEDRRGMGGVGVPAGIGGLGAVAVIIIGLFLGIDPSILLSMFGDAAAPQTRTQQPGYPGYGPSAPPAGAQNDRMTRFVSVVLADTEDVWQQTFRDMGRTYHDPKLVLYTGTVQSACGMASSASGPFYCPRDRKLYLDLSFFEQMRQRLNAPGDFAQAYVIAHEIGHHVQGELGILEAATAERARSDTRRSNAISVRLELQADCLAGVWANRADKMRRILEQGDIEEGLNAASAVGDDRLQRRARGVVVPDAFTHGSSAQRVHWFKTGLQSGDLKACDTFSTADAGG